jgi:hypothetical protein
MRPGLALESNLLVFPTGMAPGKTTKKAKPPTPAGVSNTDSLQPQGWKERYGTYAQWVGAVAGILAAVVAIAALALGLSNRSAAHDEQDFNYRVDGRIDEKLKTLNSKMEELSEKLAKIDGILETLLRPSQLKAMAALEPKEFAKALPSLRETIDRPLPPGATVDQQTTNKLPLSCDRHLKAHLTTGLRPCSLFSWLAPRW